MSRARRAGGRTSISKITRPGTAGILARERLFAILDGDAGSSIFFLVSPPGSGKTSLIASYLDSRKIPCLWYKIDEGDADVATFFHYMGMAARGVMSNKKKTLPVFSPEYLKGKSVFSRRYFEEFFGRVTTPFIIVFDNFHDVPGQSEIYEVISRGLSDVPDGIKVIISSRRSPPLPFAHMCAENHIRFLGWDDIRFTREETRAFVQMRAHGRIGDEIAVQLYEKTGGWVAGIVLMLERLKENQHYAKSDRFSSDNIFDYFAGEIFQREDRETQEFLLKTSFLPEMTHHMAERLTGIRRSEKILDGLSRDRFFIEELSQQKPVFRYHPMFSDFLKTMAKEYFGSEDLCLLMKKAALLLEEAGSIEDSVQLFRECGDAESLARIIQTHSRSLVEQGRFQTLQEWLSYLPEVNISDNAWMQYWTAMSCLPFSPDTSVIKFEVAFDQFRAGRNPEGTFLSWRGVVEAIMYGSEGLEPLDRWVFVCEELLREFNGFPSEDIEANVTCSMIMALGLRRPTSFETDAWVERIEAISRRSGDLQVRIKALISLSCYLYSEGNFQKMGIVLEYVRDLLGRCDVTPLSRLTIDWVRAAYFNVMSRYSECGKAVSEGLQLAQTLKIALREYLLLGHGVLSALKRDDAEEANRCLQGMAASLNSLRPWEADFYHYCSSWYNFYLNNLALAATHAEHCMRMSDRMGNPWTLSLAHLLKAHIAFASGDRAKSMSHAIQAYSIGIQSKNRFTPFICLMTKAYFNIRQGKETPALEVLRKGMEIGRENGFANLFMSPRGVLKILAAKALEHGIEIEYAKRLIERNCILPDESAPEIEQWPWPLRIFTLGRFEILKDGRAVVFSGKVQHKPLAMLKALIAFGGKEVAEERLSDVLWPEAEGDAAHSAFATTLSRLRRLIGIEQSIKFQEGKASLDPRHCWLDAWVFERALRELDMRTEQSTDLESERKKCVGLYRRAVEIYRGSFLGDENEPWMISTRERLRNKFLRSVGKLGRYLEEAGRVEDAVECYQRGLDVDDLVEEFYQRLMKCYLKMERRAEGLAVYGRCRDILSAVLGVEPSPETEVLAGQLRRGE